MEFTSHESDKGLEATLVTGPRGQYCKGSKKAYPQKKLRYYKLLKCKTYYMFL